ncbi:MAG: WbqC family protein [Lachnospiraceae bacterium]|nr:WbqC family protein [Lachnospiraceae bacterium]
MVVAIHQPNYIPWGGYFYKLIKCDAFVFLDDVQYTRGFINRNKIKTQNGSQWLTVPVQGSQALNINEIQFAEERWKQKHIRALEINYSRSEYFKKYASDIFNIINEANDLCNLNMGLIKYIGDVLGAKCTYYKSSDLKCTTTSDDRIIEIVEKVGGDTYFSGTGAMNYQEMSKFSKEGIQLVYSDFKLKEYKQVWGEFQDKLSIIDILFNCGSDTRDILVG